jgi:hypothetical protein
MWDSKYQFHFLCSNNTSALVVAKFFGGIAPGRSDKIDALRLRPKTGCSWRAAGVKLEPR